jgi:hypothetical protein
MRRPWPTGGCRAKNKTKNSVFLYNVSTRHRKFESQNTNVGYIILLKTKVATRCTTCWNIYYKINCCACLFSLTFLIIFRTTPIVRYKTVNRLACVMETGLSNVRYKLSCCSNGCLFHGIKADYFLLRPFFPLLFGVGQFPLMRDILHFIPSKLLQPRYFFPRYIRSLSNLAIILRGFYINNINRYGSSVGIVTMLRAEILRKCGSFRMGKLFSLPKCSDCTWGQLSLLFNGY